MKVSLSLLIAITTTSLYGVKSPHVGWVDRAISKIYSEQLEKEEQAAQQEARFIDLTKQHKRKHKEIKELKKKIKKEKTELIDLRKNCVVIGALLIHENREKNSTINNAIESTTKKYYKKLKKKDEQVTQTIKEQIPADVNLSDSENATA